MVILRCLLLALAAVLAAGEATLRLPDPWVAGVEQTAQVVIDGGGGVRQLDLPEVAGLRWGQPHGQRSAYTVINGVASQSTTVELPVTAMTPDAAVEIPAFTVRLADGSTLTTAPVRAVPIRPDPRLQGDGFAEARFEPARVVPGQPTTLVLRVWVRARQELQPGIQPPAEALSLGERDGSAGPTTGADGSAWWSATWRWPLAFSAPGSATVAGQQAVLVPTGRVDIFGQQEGARRHLPIRPAVVTVVPLPAEGRPADFGGLVGEVTAEAALDRDRIAVGEGARLTLRVRGAQRDLLRAPPPPQLPGVQAYPRPAADDGPARVFAWDLVPVSAGTVAIPPFAFPWFDPEAGAYRSTRTGALTLQVLPGRSAGLVMGGAPVPAAPPAAAAAPVLPPPVGTGGGWHPHPRWAVAACVIAVLAGLAFGLVTARRGRAPAIHRGRALAAALASRDPSALAAALHAFAVAPPDHARAARIQVLADRVQRHRFGGEPLGDLDAGDLVDLP